MESLYETYSTTECSQIPIENLKTIILQFLYDASKDMGSEFDKVQTPDRVYYIIDKHYNHLPLYMVASAFTRGALGQYGSGRLVPRTIFGWLGEINQVYLTKHNVRDNTGDNYTKFDGLHKYPLGKAINKKIDWYRKGLITADDWETIPLKELAEMIGAGQHPMPEYFKL